MFEVDKTFIDICNKNIELVSKSYLDCRPVKLHSFHNFEKYEGDWWLSFDELIRNKDKAKTEKVSAVKGQAKINIKEEESNDFVIDIPIIKQLSEHLFSKIFKAHKIACIISTRSTDQGKEWHNDYQEDKITPTYLICMNLIGKTRWEFDGYDDMILEPGDIICQHGSVAHQVTPFGYRVSLAGHSSIKNIDI